MGSRLRIDPKALGQLDARSWSEMTGGVNRAGARRVFEPITLSREADWMMRQPKI